MPLNSPEDHRWFVEELDLENTEKWLRLANKLFDGGDMMYDPEEEENGKSISPLHAFTYLRNFRYDVTQALLYGVNFKKPLLVVLADIMLAIGTKPEDIDNIFGTPGLLKQVAIQNKLVEEHQKPEQENAD